MSAYHNGGRAAHLKLWSAAAAVLQETQHLPPASHPCRSPSGFSVSHLAVAPDGSSFAVAAGKSVVRFTLDAQQGPSAEPKRKAFPPLASTVEALRFDRQGNLMAAYYGGTTRLVGA